MTSTIARIAGPLTGLVLAAVVGISPALAASAPAAITLSGAHPATQAEELTGRGRCAEACAEAWLAARETPTVETLKRVGLCEIDRRLATIERLRSAVDDSRPLTNAHEAALEAILDRSAAGLRALRAEIEADTTVAELREDIASIFEDFRIYALVTRQVWLVIGADAVDATAAKLSTAAERLAGLIEQAAASGKDVTEAQAHLAAMEAAIDEALATVDGVAADVLPLTPADWNAGTAGPILRAARQAIADARADLRTAMSEARQVLAALA
ncbi:MAG: hypothetical protein HW391_706 [Chloroflexi bacterium]|nr:hypothetical protein [Chloroflexota bacterium]